MAAASAATYGDRTNVADHGFEEYTIHKKIDIVDGVGVNGLVSEEVLRAAGGYAHPDYGGHTGLAIRSVHYTDALGKGVAVVGSLKWPRNPDGSEGKTIEGSGAVKRVHCLPQSGTLFSGQFCAPTPGRTVVTGHRVGLEPPTVEACRAGVVRTLGFHKEAADLKDNGVGALTHDFQVVTSKESGTSMTKVMVPVVKDGDDCSLAAKLFNQQRDDPEFHSGQYASGTGTIANIAVEGVGAPMEHVVMEKDHATAFINDVVKSLQPQDQMHKNGGVEIALLATENELGEKPSGTVDVELQVSRLALTNDAMLGGDLKAAGHTVDADAVTNCASISNAALSSTYGVGDETAVEASTTATPADALAAAFGVNASSIQIGSAADLMASPTSEM